MEKVLSFFDQGGNLLWAILLVSMLMWILIFERYWFYLFQLPKLNEKLLNTWKNRSKSRHIHEQRLKNSLISRHFTNLFRGLKMVNILTQILPLLGLLGTVSGMIKVFEVINVFGAGNARGMAAGISEALITTMAGLVAALSGLFIATNLESRAQKAREKFSAQLNIH